MRHLKRFLIGFLLALCAYNAVIGLGSTLGYIIAEREGAVVILILMLLFSAIAGLCNVFLCNMISHGRL